MFFEIKKHLVVLKMLVKANANIDVVNFLYQTPLVLAILVKQKKEHRKAQIEMVKYLLENNA